jgi:hypothetical protein
LVNEQVKEEAIMHYYTLECMDIRVVSGCRNNKILQCHVKRL